MKNGFAYARWKQNLDHVIHKKNDSDHVNNVWKIILYETDFNNITKILPENVQPQPKTPQMV